MDLRKELKEQRPNLSDSSITTYSSILRNLFKRVFENEEMNMKSFNESEKIIDHLKNIPPSRRKTILSALLVLTGNKEYKELMTSDLSEYQSIVETQEKSPTQKESWIQYDEVIKILHALEADAKLLYKKKALTMTDMQQIQNYVILALLSGSYIAPRRSLDYVCMKIRNVKKTEDNWFDSKKLYFNRYKTQKYYKEQSVDLPPALKKILEKWSSQNKHTDYLLFDNNSQPLTSVKLNQRLARILGHGRSVNALRHSYLQHLYGNTIELNEKINKTMSDMGSSQSQLKVYVKKAD
jgi:integrase